MQGESDPLRCGSLRPVGFISPFRPSLTKVSSSLLTLFFLFSVCLSVCLSFSLSLSLYLSLLPSPPSPPTFHCFSSLSLVLSYCLFLSISLSLSLSHGLFLSLSLSFPLSVCLSVCLVELWAPQSDSCVSNDNLLVSLSSSCPPQQLTKLHQLAMQQTPFTSLGQTTPAFPGTYPRSPLLKDTLLLTVAPVESHHFLSLSLSLSLSLLYLSPCV